MVEKSVRECPPYMKEEECRLLSWRSLLLLLFVLDLCYALGEERVVTNIDGRKISEGVSTIYERRRMPTVVVGSFFLFFLVIDLLVMHGEEHKNDHHRRSEMSERNR